ncbi:DUF1254 domain-containing protein [Roseibium aggregatum]|uniref:DUF1254 domain-containing protein n=1 Tax=Roseibium aggregatum TaxID=187304 RepID=UPI003A97534C
MFKCITRLRGHRKLLSSSLVAAVIAGTPAQALTVQDARSIAMDAYIYGYSLMTTEVTRVQMSNVGQTDLEALKAPMGQWINVPRYPPADYRGVSAPNADTLYSVSWLDLSEPQVFSYPAMGDRYFLFEVVDLWMHDLADSPGIRTLGGEARNVLFTGPQWKGTVPDGVEHISIATDYMAVLGRIYSTGTAEDYKAVNALQAQLKITPLSAWGTDDTPKAPPVQTPAPFSMTDKPQKVILDMGIEGYFDRMTTLMCKVAPPSSDDVAILARMKEIGIEPCKDFAPDALEPAVQAALESVPKDALAKIEANRKVMGTTVNGWTITKGLGAYGTDYLKRAVVAAFGWPANRQEDAVYPNTATDSTGAPLNGTNRYTVTFAKGEEPPVKGFWSITMYEIDQGWWFTPNELNKFTVSPRNDLTKNADGSLTLYFQNDAPAKDKQANWLPAPKGDFILMLRMYWPQPDNPSILDGSWTPPAVVKTN